jgi:hypothetical protein
MPQLINSRKSTNSKLLNELLILTALTKQPLLKTSRNVQLREHTQFEFKMRCIKNRKSMKMLWKKELVSTVFGYPSTAKTPKRRSASLGA